MKNCTPFFSVIIPVYNKEPYLYLSIGSVLNQTFEDFELILINDASTDNSLKEIKEFSDTRIRILHRDQPGPGGYAARNLGINEALGEWIAFLDADDVWEDYHLGSAKELIIKWPQNSFFSFSYKSITAEKTHIRGCTHLKVLNLGKAIEKYSREDYMHTNSVIIKKQLFEKSGLFPETEAKRGGDSDLWLRALFANSGIIVSPLVTSSYISDNSGVLSNPTNIGQAHPIVSTIRKLKKESDNQQIKNSLMRLANRKSVRWSSLRKTNDLFTIKELQNIFYSKLSLDDWFTVLRLILPYHLKRKLNLLKKSLRINLN